MANTYYDSELTAEEIEEVLEAISNILTPANNGKVLAIDNKKIVARSVQWGGGEAVVEPLSVIENGDYYPESGVDGFDEVHVSVPNSYTASDEGKVVNNGALVAQTARASQITQNGTYDTTLNNEVTVNVSGGGSAVIQPLSVTQNGTYTAPSGVDGYSPVTVNVSGGGGGTNLQFHYGRLKIDNGVIDESSEYCYSDLIPISAGNGQWFIDLARSDTSSYYIGICMYGQDGETQVGYVRQYQNYRSYTSSGISGAKYFRIANKVSNLSFASLSFLLDDIHVAPQTSSIYQTSLA